MNNPSSSAGDESECPSCSGRGFTLILARVGHEDGSVTRDWRRHDCTLCQGTGVINARIAARIERGRAMREARIGRLESLADAAARLGMDVMAYSRLEAGRE